MNKWLKWVLVALAFVWTMLICLCIGLSAHAENITHCTPNRNAGRDLFAEKYCNDHLDELEHWIAGWVYEKKAHGIFDIPDSIAVPSESIYFQIPKCRDDQYIERKNDVLVCVDRPTPKVINAKDANSPRDLGWEFCQIDDSSGWCAAWYPGVDVAIVGKVPDWLRCQNQTYRSDGTIVVHPYMHCGDLNWVNDMVRLHGLYAYWEAKQPARNVEISRHELSELIDINTRPICGDGETPTGILPDAGWTCAPIHYKRLRDMPIHRCIAADGQGGYLSTGCGG